jgi:hypothetical protein
LSKFKPGDFVINIHSNFGIGIIKPYHDLWIVEYEELQTFPGDWDSIERNFRLATDQEKALLI